MESPVSGSRKTKRKGGFFALFIKLAALVFIGYAAVSLFFLQTDIAQQEQELKRLNEQKAAIQAENDDYERLLDSEDEEEYYARIAREQLGYADPDERVFYVVPGN